MANKLPLVFCNLARMPSILTSPFSDGDFPELESLQTLIARAGGAVRVQVPCEIEHGEARWPLHCVEMGSNDPEAPAVGFFGGIHGVERIGTQVLLAFLHSLIERLQWDDVLHALLQQVRLVFMPLVNPGGMKMRSRCNPAGVDLMRNAPVEADTRSAWPLRGQRLSRRLPWYRGRADQAMQPEAVAVAETVKSRLLSQRFSIAVDCHSGFGMQDRIWFPYARTRKPIDCLPEIYALRSMFRATHPYHSIYIIEPQALQYTTHGDLWDYLYDQSREMDGRLFIPLTLEMGSWLWVKKSPRQLFDQLGMFNPVVPHRHQRALRRHLTLFDFLIRAAISNARWRPAADARGALNDAALAYWYRQDAGSGSGRHRA